MTSGGPVFEEGRNDIENALKSALEDMGDMPLYGMLRYFMGHVDEKFVPVNQRAGKRIRPLLLVYVAQACGGSATALDLAVGIELFHNFTLIHDDIEDHDEMRRGRPTVWKVWGVDHAINAGDVQAFIANKYLLKATKTDPIHGARAAQMLNDRFVEVAEGQYLDFTLSALPLVDKQVTIAAYMEMTRKKTSVLLGAAAMAGGMSAGCTDEVAALLYSYGESFGLAYQVVDDVASIWGEVSETGKRVYGDIIERKKTYPVLYARDHGYQESLSSYYDIAMPLDQIQVREVVHLITESGAREASRVLGEKYTHQAKESARSLPVAKEVQETLVRLVDSCVQFPRT